MTCDIDKNKTIKSRLPDLRIGDLVINPPIVLGGMGVRVTTAPLVAAVANQGCAGTIASVGIVSLDTKASDMVRASSEGLRLEIEKARALSQGPIGVNVMVALSNFDALIKTCDEMEADYVVCGAGLPRNLPHLIANSHTKLIPIVSSVRATKIICMDWWRKYERMPDAIVLEGAYAGGHLGFKYEQIDQWNENCLRRLTIEVVAALKPFERLCGRSIPLIVGGGVYDGLDIAGILAAGAAGVQIATRFISTIECEAHYNFKNEVIRSKIEDMMIIPSPVGMPLRAIRNPFVEKILQGKKVPFSCRYRCLKTCDPATAPFCIAKALSEAVNGNLDEGFVVGGYNSWRVHSIVTVKELIDELVRDAAEAIKE